STSNCSAFFSCLTLPPHPSTLFPYTTLFRSGRDGIHGASFASLELDESSEERRPAVQVGNPFLEKCLIEALQELTGHPAVVGIQDRKSTRLNSSHVSISYAVFCLKKKR